MGKSQTCFLSAASGSNPEPEAGEPVWKAWAPRGWRTRLRGQRCRGAARRGGAAGAASPLHGSRRASQNASACHSGTSGARPPSHRPRPTRRGCPCVLGASGSGRRASPPVWTRPLQTVPVCRQSLPRAVSVTVTRSGCVQACLTPAGRRTRVMPEAAHILTGRRELRRDSAKLGRVLGALPPTTPVCPFAGRSSGSKS